MARCPRCAGECIDPEPAEGGNGEAVPQACKLCGGDGSLPETQTELAPE